MAKQHNLWRWQNILELPIVTTGATVFQPPEVTRHQLWSQGHFYSLLRAPSQDALGRSLRTVLAVLA